MEHVLLAPTVSMTSAPLIHPFIIAQIIVYQVMSIVRRLVNVLDLQQHYLAPTTHRIVLLMKLHTTLVKNYTQQDQIHPTLFVTVISILPVNQNLLVIPIILVIRNGIRAGGMRIVRLPRCRMWIAATL